MPIPHRCFGRISPWLLSATLILTVGACRQAESQAQPASAAPPASAPPIVTPAAPAAATAQPAAAPAPGAQVHPCAGAGRWFPADPDQLGRLVDTCLSGPAPTVARQPVVVIVPHAGYQFSGAAAGKAYATLKGRTYKRVILFGPSHQAAVRGATVLRVDAYDTPLGRIPVDIEARDALLKCPVATEQPAAHLREHSVENQLPFLQRVLGPFKMVEVLISQVTPDERTALADAVRPLLDDSTLVVVSSDFTHYGPNYGYVPFRERVPETLADLNNMAVQEILEVDGPGWDAYVQQTRDTVCGQAGIGLLLKILEPWDDIRGTRLAFDTSGQITGDWANSVTYAAVGFWRAGEGLAAAEQATLLRLARDTVVNFLKTGQPLTPDAAKYDLTPALRSPGAAFVTLKNRGDLRGCIGHIIAVGPLFQSIIDNACHACRDPRFTANPITEQEAPALSVEISVLTPMRRISDPMKVQVGRDGLMIALGRNRGLLLPQVPGEQGWNLEQFLQGICRKAGLLPDAWRDPQAELYRFSAQVFGEEKPTK